MSKKKKHSVRKMTEQDYQNYIMALKDERPVNVVIPPDEKDDGKE